MKAISIRQVEPYTTKRRLPVDLSSPCELWAGNCAPGTGYGRLMIGGTTMYVHRVAYQLHVGPIPRGWEIDHLCHNAAFDAGACVAGPCRHRRCFNPAHLDSVPSAVNSARGGHPLHVVHRLTQCRKGHDLTDSANVIVNKNGRRRCRPCTRETNRRAYARRKAAQA